MSRNLNPNRYSILDAEKVMDIVEKRSGGASKKELAAQYNVSMSTIEDILSGRNWGSITGLELGVSPKLKLWASGEGHGQSVLTKEKVLEIVDLHKRNLGSHRSLARQFGVSKGTITAILLGWTWSNVTGIVSSREKSSKSVK